MRSEENGVCLQGFEGIPTFYELLNISVFSVSHTSVHKQISRVVTCQKVRMQGYECMNGLGDPEKPQCGSSWPTVTPALSGRTFSMLLFYEFRKRGGGQLELSNLLRDWGFVQAPQGLALTKHV